MAVHTEPGDGLNTWKIFVTGVIATIGTFATIIGLQALYIWATDSLVASRSSPPAANIAVLAEQTAKLNRTGWLDRPQNRVAIPIDQAMELTVEKLNSDRRSSIEEEDEEL